MIIQDNIAAKNTARNQKIIRQNTNKSVERLSTGFRINRAGDDAAGLAISELMRSQINGLMQADKNVTDGIGMVQTADGALTEVHSMLHRLKQLATEAANGTYSTQARANIDVERAQLMEEFDRIAGATDFDEIPLFDTDESKLNQPFTPPKLSDMIDLQIGPSGGEKMQVNRYCMGTKALQLENVDFKTREKANSAIDTIETAVQAVSEMRGHYGSTQNHLEHTHKSVSVTHENMTAAESKIRDTDVADEFTTHTKNQIMLQASMAMMTQANALPQQVLSMLQ